MKIIYSNDEYGVWWSRCEGIGPVTANKLLDEFITARNVYDTSIDEIVCCLGISEKHAYGCSYWLLSYSASYCSTFRRQMRNER